MGIHPLNVLNFSWSFFFLGAESHKPEMYNAFWEWFEMELIDAKHFSFIFEL